MKYLKKFETDEFDDDDFDETEFDDNCEYYTVYDKDDYIKLEVDDNGWNIIGPFAKIIEVENTRLDRDGNEKIQPSYKVIAIQKETNKLKTFWINEDEVADDLTQSEIDYLDILLNSNKFNI